MTFRHVAISVILLTGFFVVSARADEEIPVTDQVFDLHTLSYQREKVELPVVLAPEPPKPAPQRVSTAKASSGSVEQWRGLVSQYDWPVDRVLRIMNCESGGRADARGDGHLTFVRDGVVYGDSWGLMQIRRLPGRPTPEQLVDPIFNVQYAYNMYKASGNSFSAWTCSRKV